MAFYHEFNSARTTEADLPSLQAQLKSNDVTAILSHIIGTKIYTVNKSTIWTQPQINGTMNIINNAVTVNHNLIAQDEIDNLRIAVISLIHVLIDEINILRNLAGLQPRTYDQAIAAMRSKAGSI